MAAVNNHSLTRGWIASSLGARPLPPEGHPAPAAEDATILGGFCFRSCPGGVCTH
jgi:hypothetical protein